MARTLHIVDESEPEAPRVKSSLISRNITVGGRRTSVRLEQEMWNGLKDIALREKCTIHEICSLIDIRKSVNTSLTAAIRVFLMLYYRAAATEEGHRRAGHGNFETMRQRARLRGDGLPEAANTAGGTAARAVSGGSKNARASGP